MILDRFQKSKKNVLNGKFSQPYSQYFIRAQAYVRNYLFVVSTCLSKSSFRSKNFARDLKTKRKTFQLIKSSLVIQTEHIDSVGVVPSILTGGEGEVLLLYIEWFL